MDPETIPTNNEPLEDEEVDDLEVPDDDPQVDEACLPRVMGKGKKRKADERVADPVLYELTFSIPQKPVKDGKRPGSKLRKTKGARSLIPYWRRKRTRQMEKARESRRERDHAHKGLVDGSQAGGAGAELRSKQGSGELPPAPGQI